MDKPLFYITAIAAIVGILAVFVAFVYGQPLLGVAGVASLVAGFRYGPVFNGEYYLPDYLKRK